MLLAIDLIAYLLIAHIFCLGGRIAAVVVGGVVIVIVWRDCRLGQVGVSDLIWVAYRHWIYFHYIFR